MVVYENDQYHVRIYLHELPGDLRLWAMNNQVYSGNLPDDSVRMNESIESDKSFDWYNSIEGDNFWQPMYAELFRLHIIYLFPDPLIA